VQLSVSPPPTPPFFFLLQVVRRILFFPVEVSPVHCSRSPNSARKTFLEIRRKATVPRRPHPCSPLLNPLLPPFPSFHGLLIVKSPPRRRSLSGLFSRFLPPPLALFLGPQKDIRGPFSIPIYSPPPPSAFSTHMLPPFLFYLFYLPVTFI